VTNSGPVDDAHPPKTVDTNTASRHMAVVQIRPEHVRRDIACRSMQASVPIFARARERRASIASRAGALQPPAPRVPISPTAMPADLDAILRLEVPLIVQVADRHMPAEDVLALTPGAIMELPKSADAELEILINNKTIGLGRAVKVGENFGVRIVYIGRLEERVAALGGDESAPDEQDESSGEEDESAPKDAIAEQLTPKA
jgi:flagellar motor switch protein FliN/FliY